TVGVAGQSPCYATAVPRIPASWLKLLRQSYGALANFHNFSSVSSPNAFPTEVIPSLCANASIRSKPLGSSISYDCFQIGWNRLPDLILPDKLLRAVKKALCSLLVRLL